MMRCFPLSALTLFLALSFCGPAGMAAEPVARERGALAFWVTPKDGKWRDGELVSMKGSASDAGAIRLAVKKKDLVFSRDCRESKPITVRLPQAAGRAHVILTWNETGEDLYVNGYCHRCCARGVIGMLLEVNPTGKRVRRTFADGTVGQPEFLSGGKVKEYVLEDCRSFQKPLAMMDAVALYRSLDVPKPAVPDYAKEYVGHENPYVKFGGSVLRELVEEIRLDEAGVAELERTSRFKIVGPRTFKACDGTVYLETGREKDQRFAVAFDVDARHPLYEIEFEYPDDAVRTTAIVVQTRNGWAADSTLQVGYCTGDDHPLTGKIRSYRCLYWTGAANDSNPKPCGKLAAVVTKRYAVRDTAGAALSAIRIYRVTDARLPQLEIPPLPAGVEGRHFAVNYEDPAIGCDFGTRYTTGRGEEQEKMIDRMIAVMRYTGQDRFHYPRAWYYGFNDPEDEIPANPRAWHPHGWYEAWYAKFDREGLGFVPTVHPHGIPFDPSLFTEGSASNGMLHATAASVSDTGEVQWTWGAPKCNFAHPDTRAYSELLVDKILAEGAKHKSFRGIELRFTEVGVLCWIDETQGYNDYAVEEFAKSIGVRIPGSINRRDPLRGKAYADWLRKDHWEEWLDWRCGFVTHHCAKLANKIRSVRPDAKLYLNCALTIRPNKIPRISEGYYRPGFWPRYIRGMGLDAEALQKIDGVVMTQMTVPGDRRWFPNLKPDQFATLVARDGQAEAYPMVVGAESAAYYCFDRYWESPAGRKYGKGSAMELSSSWLKEIPWQVVTINASGANAMRPFAQALKVRDFQELMKGGYLIGTYGMEPYLRPFMAAFRALPAVPFADRVSSDPDVTIRAKKVAGRGYLYVVNTCAEPRKVKLPAGLVDLVTGQVFPGGELPLGPYELKSFSTVAPLLPIDCFWGAGGTEAGPSEGVARGWTWEKAQTGNCHPGATLPFGWMSAVAYSGAYPTGYGVWQKSSCGPAKRILERPEAWGVTHVQHSGVGAIRQYYNFIRLTPSVEGSDLTKRSRLTDERAEPGYYAASLPDYGSSFELAAVSTTAMAHRFRYATADGKLNVDLRNLAVFGGLTDRIDRVEVSIQTKDEWCGTIYPYGVPVHFALAMKGAEESVLAISRESASAARAEAKVALADGFDAARKRAADTWMKTLGRIRARFSDAKLERRFYSALYHSLLKPSDQRVGFCDFVTVWDEYRTQLPLVMLAQPETSERISRSMLATSEKLGFFPNWFTMLPSYARSDSQAIALPAYVMSDLFHAGAVAAADRSRMMAFFAREFDGVDPAKYSPTHILDLAGAYDAAATVAASLGETAQAQAWRKRSAIWKTAYDPATGLMPKDARYYEGNEMNYSFRPHVDMAARMELVGGPARFARLLDEFFAFNDDLSGWTPETDRSQRPGRFEGLNNESDMDSISSYYFVGRPDRVAELHDLIRRTRFGDGPGGLPGNNDSGATSSWYVLSSLGLVPQSGSPYWFVTVPAVDSAEIDVRGGTLVISIDPSVRRDLKRARAFFAGRELKDWRVPTKDLVNGGNLEFRY